MEGNRMERLVRVHWDAPRSLDKIFDLNDPNNDCGLYQVYGHHVVFGPGALLYIGKTCDQTFSARFDQHRAWLQHESEIVVRVGRLRREDYRDEEHWRDWKEVVGLVEQLTIYWHSPPYNTKSITRYTGSPLRVQNWGHRGRLLPEYSSEWQPARPDETDPKR